ncbi:MAG: UDP-N-acetylmuramoyl-L-alanyl-D-glutamate-2,6-diaminopimelate ligase [Parcubacteria group bacterium GW2011_GWA1_44_13]|nr:MAG: UDP-N-acetylmuramoyl-L-alanyl-D-glutamate-2,6-diaminopimelate ligase [Parcubacteria group bacterium GW2011_GWA1_44_13]
MDTLLRIIKKIIPRNIFSFFQPAYHYLFALLAVLVYRFPSRKIKIVAITGTKGKTSTAEIVNAILEEAGYKTALAGTLRFKVGDEEERNLYKMTIPGRFFVQRFLRRAVNAKCDWVIIEMTSEGARQFRHKFIDFDALIFTNLSPEHIESHGSFEKYKDAKLSIARALANSPKRPRIIIANADNEYAGEFLSVDADTKTTYSLKDAEPYTLEKNKTTFNFMGSPVHAHLSGAFNLSNMLAGISFARAINISPEVIRRAIGKFHGIRGRGERVNAGQDFDVIVDYAHTTDSLEKVYEVFQDSRKICVLGGTGGGRDTWKRPAMGAIASAHCDEIILTNEDPYDEDPEKIVSEILAGIEGGQAEVIMDRREAIARAIALAQTGDAVIITGKGTDPYIMGPNGTKTEWDDAAVAREELQKLGSKK